jgi:hypothetical protein
MSTADVDQFEARAQQAARSAHSSVRGIDMTGLAAPSRGASLRTPSRALLLAAACVVLLLVAGTLLTRNVFSHDEGVPAFQPQPLPGSQPFTPKLQPSVGYRIPAQHLASPDDPGLTVVKFDSIPAGGLVAMRVRSYANGDQPNLVSAVAADNRLKVLSQGSDHGRRRAGDQAGRHAGARHHGERLVLPRLRQPRASSSTRPGGPRSTCSTTRVPGTCSPEAPSVTRRSAKLQPIVDGAAATWHW